MIRAVLVDDHAMVREALAQILDEVHDIEVVGQGADAAAALRLVRELRPDILVLDYGLPGGGAPDVIEQVAVPEAPWSTKVVVLTVHDSIHYAVRVLEAGAYGFVVKTGAVEDLEAALRAAHAGEVYVSPDLSQKVLQTLRRPKRDRLGPEALSARELELLRRLGAGMSLKAAALDLHISPSTASTYRARLVDKLQLETTAELIRFALEHGLVG